MENQKLDREFTKIAKAADEDGVLIRQTETEIRLSESGDDLYLSIAICQRVPPEWVEDVYDDEDERSTGVRTMADIPVGYLTSAEALRLAASIVVQVRRGNSGWSGNTKGLDAAKSLLLDLATVEERARGKAYREFPFFDPDQAAGGRIADDIRGRGDSPTFPPLLFEDEESEEAS